MEVNALVMKRLDNVATAIRDLKKGEYAMVKVGEDVKTILLGEDIPFGFKCSLRGIQTGEPILKYGEPIGKASTNISPGMVVHVHNVEGTRGRGDLDR
jgi:altronate dehydratase small subunit